MAGAQMLNDRHYTYADYLKFPDDERWEIIDGVAYSMSPAPTPEHQDICSEINAQVREQLRDKPCRVFAAPFDVRFARADAADQIVQPDLLVICDRAKIDARGAVGAPDWIVEIISPSTASRDHIAKRALYEREQVPEYWLLHPVDRIVTIYRLDPAGRYGRPDVQELKGQTAVQSVPGLTIDWDLWLPLQDPAPPS